MRRKMFLGVFRRAGTAAIGLILLSLPFTAPAFAVMKQVTVAPATPASCDPVTITVTGELSDNCHEIVGAVIRGPEFLPCARPTPCPARFVVEITVREANPLLRRPCLLITTPYTRSFDVGKLAAGEYLVAARERVVPFASDSTDSTVSESFANATFTVRPDSTCPPGEGCQILWFAPLPTRDPSPRERCTASARPGGTACLDLTLMNTGAVGGFQTTLLISDARGTPPSGALIHAVSAEPVGRASGFQIGWTVDGSKTKLILYSTSGASIAPGNGPVARICYAIAPDALPQEFTIVNSEAIVADPAGRAIPPCPTMNLILPFASICVLGNACDVNGDGVSDVLDVIRLVRCALASGSDSTSACPDSVAARADCNGDGAVDIRDVICCVRKIVGTSSGAAPSRPGIGVASGGANSIGFDGPVRWIDAVNASVVLRVDAARDWGGTEFTIDASGAPGRVRALRLLNADPTDQLEWAVDANGSARAILFAAGSGTRPAHTYRVEVALERVGSGSVSGVFRLRDVRAGSSAGDQAPITSFNPTLQLSSVAVAAPMLLAARPNPTSGMTEIGFMLPSDARVNLRVYDVRGRLVRTLIQGPVPAGVHRARWDGADGRGRTARSGIYFAKLEVGETIRSERILLMR